jgi:hypothetical protein
LLLQKKQESLCAGRKNPLYVIATLPLLALRGCCVFLIVYSSKLAVSASTAESAAAPALTIPLPLLMPLQSCNEKKNFKKKK